MYKMKISASKILVVFSMCHFLRKYLNKKFSKFLFSSDRQLRQKIYSLADDTVIRTGVHLTGWNALVMKVWHSPNNGCVFRMGARM